MELKKGYKLTELGVIPNDWDLLSIDQAFEFHSTSNYSKAQMQTEGEIGCLHYGLIHSIPNLNYDIGNGVKYFVTAKQAKYEFIKEGDVVMVDASEDMSGVNKSIELNGIKDKLYISGLHTYLLRDKGYFENNFRGQILNSSFTKAQYYRLAVGMKVFGVSKKQLKTVLLPIPPKKEQSAIARALYDTDLLMQNLERLIEKKKAIKQGVLQELLIPKANWECKRLGDLGKCLRGVSYKPDRDLYSFDNINSIRLLRSNNVQDSKLDFNDLQFVDKKRVKEFQIFQHGDILICMANGSKQLVGKAAYINNTENKSYTFGAFMGCLRISSSMANSKFIYYNLLTNSYRNYIDFLLSGSSINNLNPKNIESIEINLPPIEIQNQICQILSEIDLELDNLTRKLDMMKLIKAGMMQDLLTGKIRLL